MSTEDRTDVELLTLYRTMANDQLHLFRRALLLDMREAAPETVAFCLHRVDLIDEVLRERLRVGERPQ
jgi:hypothetical protein